ncbi:MAG: hypothetical protein ACR2PO_11600, partial [Methyloligellaceae bacterium]
TIAKMVRGLATAAAVVAALAFCGARGSALWDGHADAATRGVTLVMFDSPLCEYCELWDQEIGVVYDKTPEGRFAPLRRVTKDRGPHGIGNLRAIIYTPTFVVVKDGREVGRITGYPGEDFFWPMLADILGRVGFRHLH